MDELSKKAERYINEKHPGAKGFEYDAFKDGYEQALADERERINKAINEELKQICNYNHASFCFGQGLEKAKEIVNGGNHETTNG